MAQFNIRNLPDMTAQQIEWLAAHAGLTKTQIVIAAVDRFYRSERGAYTAMDTHHVFDTTQVSRQEIEDYIVESVIAPECTSAEVLAGYNGDIDAAAGIILDTWTELYPNELPVDQDGDPLDIRRYATGYFERIVERLAEDAD
jgi:hypothetical protein